MLYQLFTRRFPFWEGDAYSKALSLDEVAKAVTEAPICYDYGSWLSMSAEGLDFIQGCLTPDPDERMTEDEALEHPWLSKLISDANEGYGAQSNNISPFQQVKGDTSVAA